MPKPTVGKKTWYKMQADPKKKTADIRIMEGIGMGGVTAADFIEELNALGKVDKINLYLLSPGGSVIEGSAIFNALASHPAEIHTSIDFAASMASVIAMAGKTVKIAENGYLMIHNPQIYTGGESKDLRQAADLLDGMRETAIKAYQRHTEKTAEEIGQMMDEATWMTGPQAVEFGFADEVGPEIKAAASIDLSKMQNVPEAAMKLFAAQNEPEEPEAQENEPQAEPEPKQPEKPEQTGAGEPAGENIDVPDAPPNAGAGADGKHTPEPTEPAEDKVKILRDQLDALRNEIAQRDEQLAELATKQKQDSERIEQLAGGFKFDPADSQTTATGKKPEHKFLAAVRALTEGGMEYSAALLTAQKNDPALHADFLRANETNKNK